jgi:hypothetical protein
MAPIEVSGARARAERSALALFRVKGPRGMAGRLWALRKPKDDAFEETGDLVQLDCPTLGLRPDPPGAEAVHGSRQGRD